MGGFVISTPFGRTGYNCIKPDGIKYLLRDQGSENKVIQTQEQITDKSKANNMAKIIVCLQVVWFCSQCIVRLALCLPICLLELNTFAHALCALFIYGLWWNKPFDVEQPTYIAARGDMVPVQAYMYMTSLKGHSRRIGKHLPNAGFTGRANRSLRVDFRIDQSEPRYMQNRQEQ